MTETTPSAIPTLAATAIGKTALALALAERYPIEIVSADSMQIYRRLDIGTAKPTAEERCRVPHHLIDVAEPEDHYDVAQFLRDALAALAAIRSRGHIPLIVGGTGLYLKSLMTGIFAVPSRDPQLREQLNARAAREGAPALHRELQAVDLQAAARLSPNDAVRIVRALEVYLSTGTPISHWRQDEQAPQTPALPLRLAVLTLPREELNHRIDQRARQMLRAGWVEEVRQLLAEGLPPTLHCFKALGYREIVQRLSLGESLEGLEEVVARQTRQFAKRQMTWFRAMKTAQWFDLSQSTTPETRNQLTNFFAL